MEDFLEKLIRDRLAAYKAEPGLLSEHAGIEETVLAGGYGYRQILELVQNGADAILEAGECGEQLPRISRIEVRLHGRRLYVANTGAPLSPEGIEALLSSHRSPKRGSQIGRFGLGFKSLLRLGGHIDVFGRHRRPLRFDPERCRAELKEKFGVPVAPGLRLAWSLPESERQDDPYVNDLDWAETIVRVQVETKELADHLRREIATFPSEFLLFFPLPTSLTLIIDDLDRREIGLTIDEGQYLLHDGGSLSRWFFVTRDIRVDDPLASVDATHIHDRRSVPIAWAMPLEGRREEVGRFWAFFPTDTPTYLPGILNAPWKLNSDRNAIISGEWNALLMREAAALIVDSLPRLASAQDPAKALDAFPRQLERKDEPATPLVEAVWTRLVSASVVPDSNGVLKPPRQLFRHPLDNPTVAAEWQSLASEPQRRTLVHPSCLDRQRSSRLKSLADRIRLGLADSAEPSLQQRGPPSWFGDVASLEAGQALNVLRLARSFRAVASGEEWTIIRRGLAIVPTQSARLVIPAAAVIAPVGIQLPDMEPVATDLASNPEARGLLTSVLGVRVPDDDFWEQKLHIALAKISHYQPDIDEAGWQALWTLLRLAPESALSSFLMVKKHSIRVRRRSGRWVNSNEALLPGGLVLESDTENSDILIGVEHQRDQRLLNLIGVRSDLSGSQSLVTTCDDPIFGRWLKGCRELWTEMAPKGRRRPKDWKLKPLEGSVPNGLVLFTLLRGGARAKLTVAMFRSFRELCQEKVSFGHETLPIEYHKIQVDNPLIWFFLEYGEVQLATSRCVSLRSLVARRNVPVLQKLGCWRQLEALLETLERSHRPETLTLSDLHSFWNAIIEELVSPLEIESDSLTDLWSLAARDSFIPRHLPTRLGRRLINSIFVTHAPDLAKRARSPERVVIVLDPKTLQRWIDEADAQDLSSLVYPEWDRIDGAPELITHLYPELDEVLLDGTKTSARCQRVSGLRLRLGDSFEPVQSMIWRGELLLDNHQLASLPRDERLKRLLGDLDSAGWLAGTAEEALRHLGDAHLEKLRENVRQGTNLADRLLRAVDHHREPLLMALGTELSQQDFLTRCTTLQLAELVIAQFGPNTLNTVKDSLEKAGLRPPKRWIGSAAIRFAASIGFPSEFAVPAEARREAEEQVSGPIELPQLHDFQQEVFDGLASLLASGTSRRRAVVSLPTGGGKTRVTVEAAVRLVLVPSKVPRSVLWIAQTDELCEQAVEAFRQVWVNLGARGTSLRIARLWGGNPDPSRHSGDAPVVVVASIQTMISRFGREELNWLRNPGIVVIDECHHAITASYSSLLRWLDAEAPRGIGLERHESPIVGLSATPFRMNDEESARLARRFDQRWLPHNQEQLYARLRNQGVLASPQYEALDSGSTLNVDEQARLAQIDRSWEGLDFENLLEAINQRLGADPDRNARLEECIRTSVEQSILFFTNSVAHANEMSARLNLAGITAAAINGDTPSSVRRWFLGRFRSGQIRVLCNHSLLTTGFDAPRTDMVLIARQVFSPVRYMQMVGRGLRGVKNGGTATCRIVTVVDNLGRFQDRHPYYYCRQYFKAYEQELDVPN